MPRLPPNLLLGVAVIFIVSFGVSFGAALINTEKAGEVAGALGGVLEMCATESIPGLFRLPLAILPAVIKFPPPVIYPAVADRIGRLAAPQRVVTFFTRMAEIETMARVAVSRPAAPGFLFVTPDRLTETIARMRLIFPETV